MPVDVIKRGQFTGGVIGLFFGGVWSVLGAQGLAPTWRLPAEAGGILITIALIVRLLSAPVPADVAASFFRCGVYIFWVALEIVAMNLAMFVLQRFGALDYLLTAVGVIVGLHFIGMWMATGMRRFLGIAAAMCLVSALAALLPAVGGGLHLRSAATGFANALVLWIGASL
ncbi:MAG: hypothetical protein ACR2NX_15295 [Chthoniobacterales bacterium]